MSYIILFLFLEVTYVLVYVLAYFFRTLIRYFSKMFFPVQICVKFNPKKLNS